MAWVWALLVLPVMAGQVPNDITGMSVAFRGYETAPGSTYCTYDTSVAFTHKGSIHVDVYARDGEVSLSGANMDFIGSGPKIYQDVLSVPFGRTATFGSVLGQHKGRYSFVVLDTFTVTGTQTCS